MQPKGRFEKLNNCGGVIPGPISGGSKLLIYLYQKDTKSLLGIVKDCLRHCYRLFQRFYHWRFRSE